MIIIGIMNRHPARWIAIPCECPCGN